VDPARSARLAVGINELRVNWAKAQRAAEGRTCIVDVNEVRLIDESGERMLRTMSKPRRATCRWASAT
jgi:hypothetical protein